MNLMFPTITFNASLETNVLISKFLYNKHFSIAVNLDFRVAD